MNLRIFTIYDKVSEESAPPVFARNEAEAIRSVTRSFSNGYKSIPNFKWTDFKLCEVGTFDSHTMTVVGCPPREVYIDFDPPKEESNG